MKKNELEKTAWAKEFKKCAPVSYPDAIKYAPDPDLKVDIMHADLRGQGIEWVVTAGDHDPTFLMEVCATKKNALALCREMGRKLLR